MKKETKTIVDENVKENDIIMDDDKNEIDEYSFNTGVVANCEKVNLRETASSDAKILTVISKGTDVHVIGNEKEFYEVITNDGATGFIMKKFIEV